MDGLYTHTIPTRHNADIPWLDAIVAGMHSTKAGASIRQSRNLTSPLPAHWTGYWQVKTCIGSKKEKASCQLFAVYRCSDLNRLGFARGSVMFCLRTLTACFQRALLDNNSNIDLFRENRPACFLSPTGMQYATCIHTHIWQTQDTFFKPT